MSGDGDHPDGDQRIAGVNVGRALRLVSRTRCTPLGEQRDRRRRRPAASTSA